MIPVSSQAAEDTRLAALADFAILDTPAEEGFDDLVHLAALVCDAPVALVSLVDRDRQWFKARVGFPACETDLDRSVCRFVLAEDDILQIPDLAADPRTRDNPLVTGEPRIRFYAGAPLRTAQGQALGSLCVIDHRPRPDGLTEVQTDALRRFARQVMRQLELRQALRTRDDLRAERRETQHGQDVFGATQADVAGAGGRQDALLDRLLAGAMEAVPAADGAALELIDGDALEYRAVLGSLSGHRGLRVPLAGSSSGRSFRNNGPVFVSDARSDPQVDSDLAEALDLGSSIHVPVSRGDRVLGVLKLQSRRAGAFAERDLGLVQLFAGTATSALTQASEAAARTALRDGEARYRAVFESIVDYAIVVLDLDGNVTDWNAGAERTLGWTADEMRGRPADVFFTPEDRAAGIAAREMRQAQEHGRGADERWHLRKGGERFYALGEMMVLRDGDGAAIGFVKVLRDRTPQRLAEERLRQADERLQMALTASGDVGLWDWMVDTDLLHGDAHFARLYGLDVERTAAGITMEQYQEFVIPKDIEPLRAAIRATFDRGADFHVEYRLAIPGQPLRWVECKGRLNHDEKDHPVRFSGTAVDVTARKAADAALRDSEARHRQLIDLSPAIIWYGLPDGSLSFLSHRFYEHTGLSPDTVGPDDWARAMHPDDAGHVYAAWQHARDTEGFYDTEFRLRDAKGIYRWFSSRAAPVRNEQGAVVGWLGHNTDIDARRTAEAEANKLAAIVEQSADFIGIANPDGTVAFVNEAGRRLVGLPHLAAARQKRVIEFFVPDEHEGILQDVLPAVARDGYWEGERHFRRFDDGAEVPVLYNIFPVRDRAGAPLGYGTVTRDLTERKRAEERQDLLNKELSHRLKNVFAMVQAISNQTLRGASDVEAAREVLGARLIALGKAHDILLGGAAESAPLTAVVREGVGAAADDSRVAYEGPEIEIGGKAALSLALTLHELTTNALKYGALSVPAGEVAVEASLTGPEDDRCLRIAWTERGGPPVLPPSRKGFGSRLIERGLTAQVGAVLVLDYPTTGVTCLIEAPLANYQTTE